MKLQDISPKTTTILIAGAILIVVVALIAGLILRSVPEEALPAVAATIPQNGQEGVLGIIPLEISFQEDLNAADQANIDVNVSPDVDKTISWTTANNLRVTLNQDLEQASVYIVSILYKNREIHSFSFTSVDKTQEQVEEEARQQAADDFLVAEAEKEFYETYPWYTSIPIETDDYVIVYNFEKESFRVRLTLGENPLGAQIEAAKTRALVSLEAIGVNLNVYDYYVLID